MWIYRDISDSIRKNADVIQVIRGPRQTGKTSLMLHLDQGFQEVSLDDPALRALAQRDPELLLKQFEGKKIFIDEAQYAPELFPSLKRRTDLYKRTTQGKRETMIRLTGSNQILMDKQIKESLAGRASFFELNTLSVSEILKFENQPIQQILYKGGWPEVYSQKISNPNRYLDNYINTYIEKDIVLSAGIQRSNEFLKFVQLLSGRIGQLLDYASLGNDVGVDGKTIKDWLFTLQRMHVIDLLPPFSSNLSSRLIKSPKVYFIDTGLACRMQGWQSSEAILTSPQQGPLFENLVFSEIYKLNINYQLGWKLFHWRSKEKEEIDFLIQMNPNEFLFIEAKVSAQPISDIKKYPEVRKVFKSNLPDILLCHQEGERILGNQIPIAFLKEKLMERVSRSFDQS